MDHAAAYRTWRAGHLVPGRIALARQYHALPQQSVANVCGTDLEAIDLWEQGVEYPSWDELQDFLALTRLPVEFFARPVEGPGALFAVPDVWEGDWTEHHVLAPRFCTDAVSIAVAGWPMDRKSLPRAEFA